MIKTLIALAFILCTTSVQAQQPTPRQILKLALGVSDTQLPKVYEIWGEKLGTVDTANDTVWRWQPRLVTIDGNTVLDSVRVMHNVTTTTTPRPAYAYEILSHWREQTITSWKAKREKAIADSIAQEAKRAVLEPQF